MCSGNWPAPKIDEDEWWEEEVFGLKRWQWLALAVMGLGVLVGFTWTMFLVK